MQDTGKKRKLKKQVFDRLTLERTAEDGGRFYRGEKGLYLFLMNGSAGDRVGRVILNRKHMTGLFKTKYSTRCRRFLGDLKNESKFLFFDETGRDEMTITWKPKRKC